MEFQVKRIVVVSDGTGRTAKRLMDAVLAQYHQKDVEFPIVKLYKEVRSIDQLDAIIAEIEDDFLVLYSIIARDLCAHLHENLMSRDVLHLDVLEPMLDTISKFLGVHPGYEPGILQVIDDNYYRKVDAIGFTVQHDDGRGHVIEEAEVILVGLSRTCKTPISMYLACNYGLKVANIPIVADDVLTEGLLSRLSGVDRGVVIGLLMQPHVLSQIREERSSHMAPAAERGQSLKRYFDVHQIRRDLQFCRNLFQSQNWTQINVTHRAIEEVSREILHELGRSESFPGSL